MKILDTDHCVAILRGRLDLRSRARPDDNLAITTITLGELVYGAHKSARPNDNLARLDAFLVGLDLLPFEVASAHRYGCLRASLEKHGQTISDLDLQIACIALQTDAPLLTHNRQHFERLTQYAELCLEDWLNPEN